MDGQSGRSPSPALLAAQRRLSELRRKNAVEQQLNVLVGDRIRPTTPNLLGSPKGAPTAVTSWPEHLGWGSTSLTRAIKATQGRKTDRRTQGSPIPIGQPTSTRECLPSSERTKNVTLDQSAVRVYPDIALGILRREQAAAGRVWLLLQFIDTVGRGWIDVNTIKEVLTHKNSALRLCGWRQLRKLLAQGNGLFWQRTRERIWLRSAAKVAASLGIWRLSCRPVSLPVAVLLEGIGSVRAHFYASFHSGRERQTSGRSRIKPIARKTMADACQISRKTQRNYEKRVGVKRRYNFALGGKWSSAGEQARAWKHGQATFRFVDHKGTLGQKGATYTAWQLPNSYSGPHRQQPLGRKKRINRELADLFMKGMTGNGEEPVSFLDQSGGEVSQRYYHDGCSAAASYNRSLDRDRYWISRRLGRGRYHLWHTLPAKEVA